MSDDQPPYTPPPGQKFIRGWLPGEWVLVNDPDTPPSGFRYTIDFHTGKRQLIRTHSSEINAVEGITSTGHDSNIVQAPSLGPPSRNYVIPVAPDPSRLGRGLVFTGAGSQDPPRDGSARPGANRYNSDKDAAAIF
jgi:hypothetical protein